MAKIICPVCAKEIKPVEYGKGWLWVCCGKVVHNSSRLDEPERNHAKGDTPDNKE